MKNLALFLSALLIAISAMAQDKSDVPEIEIKGIKFGMLEEDVRVITGTAMQSNFMTIGGVGNLGGKAPYMQFIDGKLSLFYFRFTPSSFATVRDAVAAKYPKMKCADSEVQNTAGASFDQIDCRLVSDLGVLTLSKRSSSVTTSTLVMRSHEEYAKAMAELEKKKKDI